MMKDLNLAHITKLQSLISDSASVISSSSVVLMERVLSDDLRLKKTRSSFNAIFFLSRIN